MQNTAELIGYVRLLIGDTQTDPILGDSEISLFLANATSAKLAAADALDAIATSEALLSKKITTQDLSTDGPAVAAELRKHAAALRVQSDVETGGGSWGVQLVQLSIPLPPPELTEYPARVPVFRVDWF